MIRATSLGKHLIEIVCKHAWESGFKCDHPPQFRIFDKKLTKQRRENKTIKPNIALHRCKRCGMIFTLDASVRAGRATQQLLGYPSVGFVGGES